MPRNAGMTAAARRLLASKVELPPPAERRRIREAHGFSLRQMAAAMEVSVGALADWEAGRREPRPEHRQLYADTLRDLKRALGERDEGT